MESREILESNSNFKFLILFYFIFDSVEYVYILGYDI